MSDERMIAVRLIKRGSIPEATACSGMSGGNLVEGALGAFGDNWVFLDKGDAPGDPFDGALTITFDDPVTDHVRVVVEASGVRHGQGHRLRLRLGVDHQRSL